MSTCISRNGEYSEHVPDERFTCTRCFVMDEEALFAALDQARAERDETGQSLTEARADTARAEERAAALEVERDEAQANRNDLAYKLAQLRAEVAQRESTRVRAIQSRAEWRVSATAAETERDDLRSRLACILEATTWDRPYDERLEAIRGLCDLTTNGPIPPAGTPTEGGDQ